MTRAMLIALPLVFLLGMAIQRGNTCTVVAIDDIVHRRSWNRFLAIASAWFLVAGGLVLANMATGLTVKALAFPVTVWSIVGGVLLGVGAVVNGACTTGTIARIGSGDYTFLLTIVGFFIGCLASPSIFSSTAVTHIGSPATTTSLSHPLPTLALFALVLGWDASRLIRGPHESVTDFLHKSWDPRTAILIVAVLFVAIVQIFGPFAYTELLGELSKHDTGKALPQLTFLAAILAGAVVAGKSMRGTRLIGPLRPKIVRCTLGGFIMGAGFSLAPGAFDGLTLFGQPLLLPYAWAVMAVVYITVLAGVLYLRSNLGAWIKTRRG
ncbi:MAG: YeeE/YedE thiosulfate transporter family protein [Mycobacterium sp.]